MRTVLNIAIVLLATAQLANAQPGGRGGDRGRGGPPSGGSPFGGGGFSRGGSPFGGSDRGRSGFDPAAILGRFDRNGNGMIDMDERDGFAGMMLQRFASANPNIDLSKPIPLNKLSEEFQRMRGGGGPSSDSGRGESSSASDEPQLMVPDFSLDMELEMPPGFGVVSEKFKVKVEDRDLKEAEERMRRYDRDKDGKLSRDELRSGRWSDDPMQYDRNKDGQLTAAELAVRYANRRISEDERRSSQDQGSRGGSSWGSRGGESSGWGRGGSDGWSRSRDEEKKEEKSRFGDAKSFRVDSQRKPEGLPDFFSRSDKDGDGQVMMSEYSSDWSESTLEEFLKWDLNNDGVILPHECTAALERGVRVGGGSSSSSRTSSPSTASSSSGSSNASSTEIEWAKRQISKYDTNNDGQLTAKEWEKMLIKPKGADSNGDGVLTVQEYAEFRAKK